MSDQRSLFVCRMRDAGRVKEAAISASCSNAVTQPPPARRSLSRPYTHVFGKMGSETLSFRKRFSVWSDVLQEQQLTESLKTSVTLRKVPKNVVKQERDVEDYLHDVPSGKLRPSRRDVKVKAGSKKATSRKNKKVTAENAVKKEVPSKSTSESLPSKSKKRKLKKKARKCSPAIDIALKLKEVRIDLIQKVVEVLGEPMAMRLLNETLDVEAADGLMTCNGSRRRSPGGVFFHLVKSDKNVSPQQSRAIFGDESFKRKKMTKNQHKSLDSISTVLDSVSMSADVGATGPETDVMNNKEAGDPLQ